MKVLVTGGTGFLGQRVVRRLLAAGTHVRCLVRGGRNIEDFRVALGNEPRGQLEFCVGRLEQPGVCEAAVQGCQTVYHLAAEMRGAVPVLFLTNVVATRALLAAGSRAGIGRFVLVSSLAVYGTAPLRRGDVLDERCPLDPEPHRRDAYTYSKVAQEHAAWEASANSGLSLTVVRPGVIYGPGRDCLGGRLGLRVGSLLLMMGGNRQLPYTHVENCARAVALAGEVPRIAGEAFNIIDDGLPTGRQLLRQYRAAGGRARSATIPGWAVSPLSGLCEWYHHWSGGQLPAVLTRYKSEAMWKPLTYSNAKAKAVLGWAPEVDFPSGLRETVASLQLSVPTPKAA